MSTLAARLQAALDAKPGATQAELARYCKTKPPSVSDWFRGETQTLKAQSLILAAEYLGVRARWLLDGTGPMRHPTEVVVMPPAPADVPAVLVDAIGDLPPARWTSVRAQLDSLVAHPEAKPEITQELRALLQPAPGKQHHAA